MPAVIVGIYLFQDYETLDVMGPAELLGVPPTKDKFQLLFISQDGGHVTSAQGVTTVPAHSFANCPVLDVLLVPGTYFKYRTISEQCREPQNCMIARLPNHAGGLQSQ